MRSPVRRATRGNATGRVRNSGSEAHTLKINNRFLLEQTRICQTLTLNPALLKYGNRPTKFKLRIMFANLHARTKIRVLTTMQTG